LPADAHVERAEVTVPHQPGGVTSATEIAENRASAVEEIDPDDADHAIAIDFGRLVTVSDVFAIPSPTAIRTWSGDRFFGTSAKEMRTERLLLEFVGTGDVDSIGPGITFRLPTIPSGLEVSVDGATTWFEGQGSAAGSEPPEVGDGVSFVVDVTEAVRTALAAKVASGDGSTVPLSLALSAATPGDLTLDAEVTIHRVHQVAFPEGPARTVEAAEEGPIGVELQLAEPGALPIGVVEGVYLALQGQTMEQVHQTFLAQNPDLVRVVARNPEGETVTPADEALIRQAFNSRQLPIVNEPGRDLTAAMQTLRVAQNFGA